jgi:hypothetical protein
VEYDDKKRKRRFRRNITLHNYPKEKNNAKPVDVVRNIEPQDVDSSEDSSDYDTENSLLAKLERDIELLKSKRKSRKKIKAPKQCSPKHTGVIDSPKHCGRLDVIVVNKNKKKYKKKKGDPEEETSDESSESKSDKVIVNRKSKKPKNKITIREYVEKKKIDKGLKESIDNVAEKETDAAPKLTETTAAAPKLTETTAAAPKLSQKQKEKGEFSFR